MTEALLPVPLELRECQSGRGQNARFEVAASDKRLKQRCEARGRISPGKLRHGRGGECVGGVRGRGRPAERAIETREIGYLAPDHRQVELEATESVPLASTPGGVPFVEPEWDPNPHGLMQREVRELVPEGSINVLGVRSKQNDPLAWQRHGRPPGRRPTSRERVETPPIRNHDEPQRTRCPAAQSRPVRRRVRSPGKIGCKIDLSRPCDGRYLPYPNHGRLGLG
jgi:hypothetical protein